MKTQTITQIKAKNSMNYIDLKDLFPQDIKLVKELVDRLRKNKVINFIKEDNREDINFDNVLKSKEVKNKFKQLGALIKKKYGANNYC